MTLLALPALAGEDCPFCRAEMVEVRGSQIHRLCRGCSAVLHLLPDGRTVASLRQEGRRIRFTLAEQNRRVPPMAPPISLPASPVGLPGHAVPMPAAPVGLPASPVGLPASPVGLPASPLTFPGSLPIEAARPVGLPAPPMGAPGVAVPPPASPVGMPGHAIGRPGHPIGVPPTTHASPEDPPRIAAAVARIQARIEGR